MATHIALSGREDVSRFMVHLTRNNKRDYDDGGTARENLRNILSEQRIRAISPHCTFNRKVKKLPEKTRRRFNTACFTETPLNQIHLLVQDIPGRSIKLSSYGICFRKDFIVSKGGQPALYINEYDGTWLRECVDAIYEDSVFPDKLIKPLWRLLPFVNSMHDGYDFSWEREWRVRGDLTFATKDIVCLILPDTGEDKLKERMAKNGIAVISPGWTYEQIVAELANQQRTTRSLSKALGNSK
ncbi:MAG: abortive infection system antitoxin AbiGi family protein [Afipia sp.]